MKSSPIVPLILCIVWLLSSTHSYGQQKPPGYWFRQFTDESGLPQNSVKAIMQDRNGFVWLTTEAGLTRFDGHRFMTFEKSVIPISTNRIRGFVPALGDTARRRYEFYALSEKNEYIGIRRDGLVSVDPTFYTRYQRYNPFSRNETRHNSILASLPAQYHIDPASEHYFAIANDGSHFVWIKDQVICFRKGKRVFTSKGHFRHLILVDSHPYGIDDQGNLLALGNIPRKAALSGDILANRRYVANRNHHRLFWNNTSHQAFLYLDRALYLLKPSESGNLTTQLLLEGFDFDNLDIIATFFDAQSGCLFLGSRTKGLLLFKKEDFHTHKLQAANADNVYYAQVAGRGSVLTAQGYLFSMGAGASGPVITRVSPFLEKISSKFCMARCPDGTFWVQFGFDVYKMDAAGRKVLAHITLPEKAQSLFLEPGGRLWVGCETNGIYSIEEKNDKHTARLMFRLGVKAVTILGQENSKTLFLATENALYRLNSGTGALRQVKPFENITVRSCYTTPDGTWITSYGNGFFLLKGNRVVRFPLDSDRFLATAHCIVGDRKGFFWITTNRGLFQVAKKQLLDYAADNGNPVYYLFYDKSNGFTTNEFNGGCQPCASTLADGTVSLPSMDGLVWYKPEEIKPELPDKGIFINSVREDNEELDVADTLEVSRDFEQLRVAIATPYFGNVRNVQIQYSLTGEGRPEHWVPVNADLVIAVSNVPYGEYLLKIKKKNGFGLNDFSYKTVHLRVPRAWYETWWFRSLVLAMMAGLFFVSVKWRTAHLAKKEREASLIRHYRVISQITAAVNHDIQTPLYYIDYALKLFNDYLHKQGPVDPLMLRLSDETLNTSQRLNARTKNILDYIKLQSKSAAARTDMATVDVYELVSTVSDLFAAIAAYREVLIQSTVAPGFTVHSDRNLLSIVIHNLVDNALKVCQSEISVSSVAENGQKQILIGNDGKALPEELAGWLNRNYRSYEEWVYASRHPGRKGIGLVIVKDLCVLLGIGITATSPRENCTLIRLTFGSDDQASAPSKR